MVIQTLDTEHKIRMFIRQKRIRLKEFFVDFDPLRELHVTKPQFIRCVDKAVRGVAGVKLSNEELDKLASKYLSKHNGMVCYQDFVETIDQNFKPDKTDGNPEAQQHNSVPHLGTERSQIEFPTEIKWKIRAILEQVAHYYHYRTLNIRSTYEDYDVTNAGIVGSYQFIKYFPGPPECHHKHVIALANYYEDPKRPLMVNYMNYRNDLAQVIEELYTDEQWPSPTPVIPADPSTVCMTTILNNALERIRNMVHKRGVRTTEFFKDNDPLRSGVITRQQFYAGLKLGIGKEAQLTEEEIDLIADYLGTPDARVHYKFFCDLMEHAYNVPRLDKKPTVHPAVPPSGALMRPAGSLTSQEELDLADIMKYIRAQIKKRQLLLQPYFKDHDRSKGYTRVINKSQFGRILSIFNLLPKPQYLDLICRKFIEPFSGDVNYTGFCQAVDHEFVHHIVDPEEPRPKIEYVPPPPIVPVDTSKVDMREILRRIRAYVTGKRVRFNDYFYDYDMLRSGLVSKTIFARVLKRMGIEWLSTTDVYALQKRYESELKPDLCSWWRLKREIEYKVEPYDLERHPNMPVPEIEAHALPHVGAIVEDGGLDPEEQSILYDTIHRMHERAVLRRINLKPTFQDFDWHKNGHVSKWQWRQVLSMLDFPADDKEFQVVKKRFSDDIGFDYSRFLEYLVPEKRCHWQYKEKLAVLNQWRDARKPPDLHPCNDLNEIFEKIKIRVAKERARAHEFFKDYDKLRCGLIKRVNFIRALDLTKWGLKESEVQKLCDFFTSPDKPDYISYWPFVDEIESVFTLKHLDKNPNVTPVQFKPPVDWHINDMTGQEAELSVPMKRIAKYVARNRTQLYTFFRDYDVTHNGHCTGNQFHRVLCELDLGKLVSEHECRLIRKRYQVIYGEQYDVNYEAFCDTIYAMAGFVPNRP